MVALFGMPTTAEEGWGLISYLFTAWPNVNWISFVLGTGSLFTMFFIRETKKMFPRFIPLKFIPAVLVVVGFSMLLSWSLDFKERGVATLDEISSGYPAPTAPPFTRQLIAEMIPASLYMSIVGMVGSLVAVRQFSAIFRYTVRFYFLFFLSPSTLPSPSFLPLLPSFLFPSFLPSFPLLPFLPFASC